MFNKKAVDLHRIILALGIILILSACTSFRFPGVHRITIQQGNVVTQKMINQLKPGMTKGQIKFILGNPIVDDSFDRQRWDYIYTIQIGASPVLRKTLALYFVKDRLSYFEGHFIPTEEAATLGKSGTD